MPTGSVPCRSCGRPMHADSVTCPSCGMPVDGPDLVADAGPEVSLAAIDESAAAGSMAAGGIAPASAVPGSYLSPSAVLHAPLGESISPAVMPLAGTSELSTAVGGISTPRPGHAPLLADLPFDAPNSLPGWLVAIGSTVAALTFLLPWAPGIVSYTSSWGLSSLANLPILALLITTAVMAILPNPVPLWIRSGVLGLIGGSLFLGLLWPYVMGDFGAEFGSIAGAAAAIVLIVGGILSSAPQPERPPAS